MTNYYIKIVDEIPLGDDESLWFKINADEVNDTDEILVLRRNRYEELKALLEKTQNDLSNSTILQNAVNSLMQSYLDTHDIILDSENLVSSEDNSLKWNYNTIANIKTDINNLDSSKMDRNEYHVDTSVNSSSTYPVQNQAIKRELDKKADATSTTNSLNSLKTTLGTKSDKTHTHGGWTYKKLNDYATIYYNDALRLCDFRYYRSQYNFTKTDSFTLHTGLIPSAYRPKFDIILPFYHYHLIGYIGDNGNFQIKADNKTKYAINTRAIWHY